MSIGYYVYKLQEISDSLGHIYAYLNHEDIDSPALKDAIEALHHAANEIREAEEYKREREEIYESESKEREELEKSREENKGQL